MLRRALLNIAENRAKDNRQRSGELLARVRGENVHGKVNKRGGV